MFCEFAIIGTTASGKSDLAIDLARDLGGVILSLDSLCIYKQINIASAKPTPKELDLVRHFGVDLVFPNEHFCVADFIKEYQKAKFYAKNADLPLIITGGSGFYLNAMLSGLSPKIPHFKIDLNDEKIWILASKFDPEFSQKFSKNDKFRLHKWYEIYKFSGEIPSLWLKNNTAKPTIERIKIFWLDFEKEALKERILARTSKMIKSGLLSEANVLFSQYGFDAKALKCIGLKECGEFFRQSGEFEKISYEPLEILGELKQNENFTTNPAIMRLFELISTHTIQLAKRQRTFFNSKFQTAQKISPHNAKAEILGDLERFWRH